MRCRLALLALFASVVVADAATIDFTQHLLGANGQEITEGDGEARQPLTLGAAAVTALETVVEADRGMKGARKYELDQLARKVYKNAKATLSLEEVALIKERIGLVYSPVVVGAAWPLLDPSLEK